MRIKKTENLSAFQAAQYSGHSGKMRRKLMVAACMRGGKEDIGDTEGGQHRENWVHLGQVHCENKGQGEIW